MTMTSHLFTVFFIGTARPFSSFFVCLITNICCRQSIDNKIKLLDFNLTRETYLGKLIIK